MARVVYIKVYASGMQEINYSNVRPSKKRLKEFLDTEKLMEGTKHYKPRRIVTIPKKSKGRHENVPGLVEAQEFLGRGKEIIVFHSDPKGGQKDYVGGHAKSSSVASWLLFPQCWSHGIRTSAVAIAED